MKVGKTGIEADRSNSTSSVTIASLSACTLSLLDGVDKNTNVKTGVCVDRGLVRENKLCTTLS